MRSAVAAEVNRHPQWFTALVAVVAYTLSVLVRAPCIVESYGGAEVFTSMRCYSDIPPLFSTRGLADGLVPYLHNGETYRQFEYPVVTGALAYLAASVTNALGGSSLTFYLLHIAALGFLFVLTVLLTGLTAQPRRWDALLVAISPALLLAATINWDMLTLALVAAWLLLWSRKATLLAGVALGLAISAKFYPVIFLGPLFLLCLRTANMRSYWSMCAGALGSWLVVNTPIALANPEGWAYFYTFSSDRGIDLGSAWLALSILGWAVPPSVLNVLAVALFASACLGIAILIWFSPTVPRLAPMLFLTLAAFLLVNKVYSPQFVMWMVPLAVLALPRLVPLLIWQGAEVAYFASVWWYAAAGTPTSGMEATIYALVILTRVAALAWLCTEIVRITLRPQSDTVRLAGIDPAGGVLAEPVQSGASLRTQSGPSQDLAPQPGSPHQAPARKHQPPRL